MLILKVKSVFFLLLLSISLFGLNKICEVFYDFSRTADCFRRDEIDATHYPVFHQMEVVRSYT